MEDVYEWKGLNGQLVTFKKEVGDAEKITFVGSPGVCTPFAEFLAYSVRDRKLILFLCWTFLIAMNLSQNHMQWCLKTRFPTLMTPML